MEAAETPEAGFGGVVDGPDGEDGADGTEGGIVRVGENPGVVLAKAVEGF